MQPLRLAAMGAKAHQVASLLRHLLTADEVLFGDPPLFFKQLQEELAHPYYPEIVLGFLRSVSQAEKRFARVQTGSARRKPR